MAKAHKSDVAALSKSPSHLLHRVLQLALDIYAEETGKGALTQRQYAVLAAASTVDGASQTDLVRMTGIDRSTLADMMARMIERGWLARERSAVDGRAKTVRLTEKGLSALKETAPRVEAADERIMANLTASRRSGFISALAALADAEGAEIIDADEAKARKKAEKAAAKAEKVKDKNKAKKKKKKAQKLQAAE